MLAIVAIATSFQQETEHVAQRSAAIAAGRTSHLLIEQLGDNFGDIVSTDTKHISPGQKRTIQRRT